MSKIIGLVTEEKANRQQNPYLQINLKTSNEILKAVVWDIDKIESDKLPKKGDYIEIDLSAEGTRDQRNTRYNNIIISVNSFNKIQKSNINTDILDKIHCVPKYSSDELHRAYEIITDKKLYSDPKAFMFTMACLASLPKEQFLTCPAAQSMHHHKQGGLLVHTAEVIQLARGQVEYLPNAKFINSDLVFAGATLHDIGKIFTYGLDETGLAVMHPKERTIGHIYYSMSIVQSVAKESNLDPKFLDELLHIIASHHHYKEYGSIKEPKTLEAIIVCQADYLSAYSGILANAISTCKDGKPFESVVKNDFVLSDAVNKVISA